VTLENGGLFKSHEGDHGRRESTGSGFGKGGGTEDEIRVEGRKKEQAGGETDLDLNACLEGGKKSNGGRGCLTKGRLTRVTWILKKRRWKKGGKTIYHPCRGGGRKGTEFSNRMPVCREGGGVWDGEWKVVSSIGKRKENRREKQDKKAICTYAENISPRNRGERSWGGLQGE